VLFLKVASIQLELIADCVDIASIRVLFTQLLQRGEVEAVVTKLRLLAQQRQPPAELAQRRCQQLLNAQLLQHKGQLINVDSGLNQYPFRSPKSQHVKESATRGLLFTIVNLLL
jgi:hypothetical protein